MGRQDGSNGCGSMAEGLRRRRKRIWLFDSADFGWGIYSERSHDLLRECLLQWMCECLALETGRQGSRPVAKCVRPPPLRLGSEFGDTDVRRRIRVRGRNQ